MTKSNLTLSTNAGSGLASRIEIQGDGNILIHQTTGGNLRLVIQTLERLLKMMAQTVAFYMFRGL